MCRCPRARDVFPQRRLPDVVQRTWWGVLREPEADFSTATLSFLPWERPPYQEGKLPLRLLLSVAHRQDEMGLICLLLCKRGELQA